MSDADSSRGRPGRQPREYARRISWLEPPASRCCTALHTGNTLPDRSNSTRFGWRNAGCSRNYRNPDKSPSTDNHNTSTPVRGRPTTSHTARRASHGTSAPRARRRSRCASPRSYRGTRRRGTRPRGTRRRGIHRRETRQTLRHEIRHRRGNRHHRHARRPAPMGRVGDIWLAENSCTQQRGCHAHQTPRFPGPGSVIA